MRGDELNVAVRSSSNLHCGLLGGFERVVSGNWSGDEGKILMGRVLKGRMGEK